MTQGLAWNPSRTAWPRSRSTAPTGSTRCRREMLDAMLEALPRLADDANVGVIVSPAPGVASAPAATSRPWPRVGSSAAPRWRESAGPALADGGLALAARAAQANDRHDPRRGGRRRALAGAGLRLAHRRRLRALRHRLRARRLLRRLRRQLVPHPARRHRQGARALLHPPTSSTPSRPSRSTSVNRVVPGCPARRADAWRWPPSWPAARAWPSRYMKAQHERRARPPRSRTVSTSRRGTTPAPASPKITAKPPKPSSPSASPSSAVADSPRAGWGRRGGVGAGRSASTTIAAA